LDTDGFQTQLCPHSQFAALSVASVQASLHRCTRKNNREDWHTQSARRIHAARGLYAAHALVLRVWHAGQHASRQSRAFRAILADAGRTDLDPKEFYSFWERRNVAHYDEPYRMHKEICQLSLYETYEKFGVTMGRDEAIQRYFDCFASMQLYPDVLPALDSLARNHKPALISNIDDDLLSATPLGRAFDLVCTAERARSYKPDGKLFRYLLEEWGLPVSGILHCGQSQFTDMVGGKPLGLTIAWINRRGLLCTLIGADMPSKIIQGRTAQKRRTLAHE
jgi:2-haloacid dehalogenase